MPTLPADFLAAMDDIMPAHLNRDAFASICQTPLRRAIRVNTLKISVADFYQRMTQKGWQLQPVPWCASGFWPERPDESRPLGNEPEHLLGLYYVQEASSMLPAEALWHCLQDKPQQVLDMAAAPGSKTTQLAALMDNQGLLVANEYSASRIKGLSANLQRLGVANTAITHFAGQALADVVPETFDAILLDAPCGGEGTIRKDPDALKNWSWQHIDEISAVQRQLLHAAFTALKVGGVLVYSTCTLNHQENQHVLADLLEREKGNIEIIALNKLFSEAQLAATSEGYLHIWPHIYDSEGFFVAALRKRAAQPDLVAQKRKSRFPFQPVSGKDATLIRQYLQQQLGFTGPLNLWQRDGVIWHFAAGAAELSAQLRFERLGLKVVEPAGKDWRVHHDFVMAFGEQCRQTPLSLAEAAAYLQGRDIPRDGQPPAGEQIVSLDGFALGAVKALKNKLKNRLPRELVRDNLTFT